MSDGDWGEDYSSSIQKESRENSRGRGRGRGRGKVYRNNDNESSQGNDTWGNDNDNGDQGGSSRGRGGRGRGRGSSRFSDRNGDTNGENGNFGNGDEQTPPVNDKPRPTYIPPEIDDNDFNGVEVGTNFDKYEHIEVKVSGDSVPKHIETFKTSGLREVLLEKLTKCNYTTPTPIQKYSIPVIINGRDMMASAQTGSGKTVSFYV